MRHSVLALCRNRAGFEAAPERPLKLDLRDVERRLREAGHDVLGNAGILLAARIGGTDASLFESGKVLFKTRDAEAAERAMALLREAMGWEGSP